MKYIIGIDIGTSATKTVLFDENMNVVEKANYGYEISSPFPMHAEQNPLDWWKAVKKGIKDVVSKTSIDKNQIKGLGLSGQMHGLVLLDEQGNVLMPSIIWCDQRTQTECQEISELIGKDNLIEITANHAMTGFTASKIMWVKKNCPTIYKKTKHILLPKDYIRYMLTGDFATDVSDASGTQLLDIKNRNWSQTILQKLDIEISLLPKVYESQDITGHIASDIQDELGLPSSCLVVGGAGDQAAAAIGCGIIDDGNMSITIGSSGVIFAATDKPLVDKLGRVNTLCHAVKNKWHIMSVTQSSGLALKWLKEDILNSQSYSDMDELAKDIPAGSDGLIFLPYLMGERSPIIDPNAKGIFYGLTYRHKKAHIIRSLLEGVALSQKHCLKIIEEMGLKPDIIKLNGGGAESFLWSQIIADCLNRELTLMNKNEGGAVGVAILAGVASGLFFDLQDAISKFIGTKGKILPEDSCDYEKLLNDYLNLYERTKNI